MKKNIFLFTASLFFLLSGCNKDQQLVNDLEGTWQVKTITAIDPGSKPLPSEGYISFQHCKNKDSRSDCNGSYKLDDEAVVSFEYNANVGPDDMNLNMLPDDPEAPYTIRGLWKILKKEKKELIIEGPLLILKDASTPQEAEEVNVRISLSK